MGPQAARIMGQSPGGQGVQSLGSPASLASTAGQQRSQFPVTGPHIRPLQAQGLCPGRPWIWLWVTSPQGGLVHFLSGQNPKFCLTRPIKHRSPGLVLGQQHLRESPRTGVSDNPQSLARPEQVSWDDTWLLHSPPSAPKKKTFLVVWGGTWQLGSWGEFLHLKEKRLQVGFGFGGLGSKACAW